MSRCIVYISHQQSTPGNVLNCCILEVGRQFPSTIMFIFEEGESTLKTILCHVVDPAFRSMRSHSMTKLVFYLFVKKLIFRKNLESPLIFVLFFFKQNKIRKKTINVTSYLEKTSL